MALPQVKALGLFAVIVSITGISFAVFMNGANAKLQSVLQIGSTATQTAAVLFIPITIIFLYGAFRT